MKRSEMLKAIKKGITYTDPKADVILFGSRARDEARQDSDWDILVLSQKDKITFEDEIAFREQIFELELNTGEVVSLLIYSKKDWDTKQLISPLFHNVKNEGVWL
jgi:predicted nucleotidyltransferase